MLIVVLVLAAIGLAVLAAAIFMGNTILALIVIALALVGLGLLTRDWLRDRRRPKTESTHEAEGEPAEQPDSLAPKPTPEKRSLEPDLFEPDVSYEGVEETNGE